MIDLKKMIENVVADSQLNQLPDEIQPARLFTWDTDLNQQKDWDNFINGQKVAHTY